MTRRHFAALAWELRQCCPVQDETDASCYAARQWDLDVLGIADACASFNGRFDRGRFLVAAGYTHRPDGSMYPSKPPQS